MKPQLLNKIKTHRRVRNVLVEAKMMNNAAEAFEVLNMALDWYGRNILPIKKHKNKELSEYTPAFVDAAGALIKRVHKI